MSKNKTRTKDKYRVVYNDTQRIELENEFRLNEYIAIPRKQEIAHKLQLSERQIKIWFQNRRAKKRKQQKRRQTTTTTSTTASTTTPNSSATTIAPSSVTAIVSNNNNNSSSQLNHNYNNHHHQHEHNNLEATNNRTVAADGHQTATPSEYYSMKVSPCKTATTTLTANTTNSTTTTTNVSTANMMYANYCSGPVCANDGQSLEGTNNGAKFATLNCPTAPINTNSPIDLEQQQQHQHHQHQQFSRYKTMPHHGHQARPISSFLPSQMLSAYQFSGGRGFVQPSNCNQLPPFGHQDGLQKQPEFQHPAEQQLYNDGENINLALINQQQQNQRMLACNLKRLPNHCQPSLYGSNGCEQMQQQQQQVVDGQQNDLSSLIAADCQQMQHQPPLLADPSEAPNGNNCNYVHYQTNPQHHQIVAGGNEMGQLGAGHQFNSSYNAPSMASGSTSTTNSSQATSSGNSSLAANSNLTNTAADQLISLTTIGAGQGNTDNPYYYNAVDAVTNAIHRGGNLIEKHALYY